MRLSSLLPAVLLAGCAGHLADYVGPRGAIVSPQLIRYGLDLAQTRCVGDYLAGTLTPRKLRLFARAAGGLREGWFEPGRLTVRDLAYLASRDHPEVARAFPRALETCRVTLAAAAAPAPGPGAAPGDPGDGSVVTILGPGQLPPPGGAPGALPLGAPRPSTWLNLGAAGSGQTIAIDASTIEQEGELRTAWFRMTDPGAAAPSPDAYLLRIDCARRTINARARRREAGASIAAETRDYPDNPLPVEGGTVMEIAFLSMCT